MGNNISNASDAALARITFILIKSEIRHSYKDYLATEILNEEGSMALHALSTKLSYKELRQIPMQILEMISMQPKLEILSPEDFMHRYRALLLKPRNCHKRLTTLHLLRDIISDRTTHASRILANYGISESTLDELIQN